MKDGRGTKVSSAEEYVEVQVARMAERRCSICGEDSGTEPLLPAGWSYLVFRETKEITAFCCHECAPKLGLKENRNYAADRN